MHCAASYEARSIVKFLNAKNLRACEIHREITSMYSNVMDESSVRRLCRKFNKGRENVQDKERNGWPHFVTGELSQSIDEFI